MEPQILQQDDLSIASLVHGLFDFFAYAVLGEDDLLVEQLLELGYNRLEAVLLVDLSVGSPEMRHEDYSLGSVFDRIFDSGEGADDALVVCDLVAVERDVEIDLSVVSCWAGLRYSHTRIEGCSETYSDKDALALEIDVANGELV